MAIVASRFNEAYTDAMVDDCVEAFEACGIPLHESYIVRVPGSFELPVIAEELAQQKKFDAIVCIGVVIKGETTHDHYIADAVSNGLVDVGTRYRLPVIFGVLTTQNKEQTETRSIGGGKKGWEAGMTAVEMALLLKKIRSEKV